MRQDQDPDDSHDEDVDRYQDQDNEYGRPVYQGTGLTVRALNAEEIQRFLDAHTGPPAQLLGSGWAALDPPGDPLVVPQTPPPATLPVVAAEPITCSLGSPGRSALAQYRRRRAVELASRPSAGRPGCRQPAWNDVELGPLQADHADRGARADADRPVV
jgi:hypothetical protein